MADTQIVWDPSDEASTKNAEKEFNEKKKEGFDFFEVSETKGKQVKKFNKKLGKIIAAPGRAKSTAQRTEGRGFAGGPLDARRGLGRTPVGFDSAAEALTRR